jgi:probable DNA metabolism protein
MALLLYDKTFDGFLTIIFEVFKNKIVPDRIERMDYHEPMLWMDKLTIATDEEKAGRVWTALKKRLTERGYNTVYRIHLSEVPEAEMILFRFIQKVFASAVNIEENFSDPDVLRVKNLDKKLAKDAERILQFVRFQKTADNIYYASFEPQFNVLPLVVRHFENRFADQQWIIYDTKRRYGFYYDMQHTNHIELTSDKVNPFTGKISDDILADGELLFQDLWKKYFKSICIEERRNEKLQIQHMPKRYWKYLTEKQG